MTTTDSILLLQKEIQELGSKVDKAFEQRVRTEEQLKGLRETITIQLDQIIKENADHETRIRFLETRFWKYFGAGMGLAYILSLVTPYIIAYILDALS